MLFRSKEIAQHLVYSYEDHGFVIDVKEAAQILGNDMIKFDTPEFRAAFGIGEILGAARLAARHRRSNGKTKCYLHLAGGIGSKLYAYSAE